VIKQQRYQTEKKYKQELSPKVIYSQTLFEKKRIIITINCFVKKSINICKPLSLLKELERNPQ
jgi:hypothetical protein